MRTEISRLAQLDHFCEAIRKPSCLAREWVVRSLHHCVVYSRAFSLGESCDGTRTFTDFDRREPSVLDRFHMALHPGRAARARARVAGEILA